MEQIKKISGAEFVRIVTGGEFFRLGYLSKNNSIWNNEKSIYTSDALNVEQTCKAVILLFDMVKKIRGFDENDWVTAKKRSKDIVHSDEVYEELKDGNYYLIEYDGQKLLVHDYIAGRNLSIKLMRN